MRRHGVISKTLIVISIIIIRIFSFLTGFRIPRRWRRGWETRWCESFDETDVLKILRERAPLVGDYERRWHYVFCKRPVSAASLAKAAAVGDARFVCVEQMYS